MGIDFDAIRAIPLYWAALIAFAAVTGLVLAARALSASNTAAKAALHRYNGLQFAQSLGSHDWRVMGVITPTADCPNATLMAANQDRPLSPPEVVLFLGSHEDIEAVSRLTTGDIIHFTVDLVSAYPGRPELESGYVRVVQGASYVPNFRLPAATTGVDLARHTPHTPAA